jgi:hypothetical protein
MLNKYIIKCILIVLPLLCVCFHICLCVCIWCFIIYVALSNELLVKLLYFHLDYNIGSIVGSFELDHVN